MNAITTEFFPTRYWHVLDDGRVPVSYTHLESPAYCWGRFDSRLSGRQPLLRVVEDAMNLRSRLTGIATGDQGIFVRRDVFEHVGGYPAIALMEDIALSRLLKRQGRPVCLRQELQVSSRRWERDGIARTLSLIHI